MFSSNQILKISGDKKEQLLNIIKFIQAFEHEEDNLEHINGLKESDGKLIFGWIPKEDGKFCENYAKQYDKVFDDPIYFNESILIEIIWNWLKKQDDIYEKLYEEENAGYWDTPTEGFLVTGLSDEAGPVSDIPAFATFMVEPFWTEYLD